MGEITVTADGVPAGATLKYDVEVAKIELSGLKIEVLHVPKNCDRRTVVGDYIAEHYNGTLTNGKSFDTRLVSVSSVSILRSPTSLQQ